MDNEYTWRETESGQYDIGIKEPSDDGPCSMWIAGQGKYQPIAGKEQIYKNPIKIKP